MKILIYLGHPAQFHFFKNIIKGLQEDGHQIKILLKTKDILEQLVQEAGFDYVNIQKNIRKNNIFSIAKASLIRTFHVHRIIREYKADMILGGDASVAQASKLLNIPGITVTEDDIEIIAKMAKVTFPFSDSIVVPSVCRTGKWDVKKIPYYGYMKLAYLHPHYFTPDQTILKDYISEEKYCIVRLAQLTAFHDVGINGLNVDLVLNIISLATEYGYRVYISSESKLDEKLSPYQLKIKYADIHHIMSFASLLISDSQSMSVEAAMLGIPSLRFSDFTGRISVLEELEHTYELTYGIKTDNPQKLFDKLKEIFTTPNLREEFQSRREKMLGEKIDVTAFFIWFIENYPESKKIMKQNPEYQYRFK
jgi:predicted glycosyltransferase